MKKIMMLMLLLCSLSFAKWDTVEIVDDFEEPTGEIALYTQNENGTFFRLINDRLGVVAHITMSFDNYIIGNWEGIDEPRTVDLKFRNEKGELLTDIEAEVLDNNNYVVSISSLDDINSLKNFLLKSKMIKIVATGDNNKTYLDQFNVENLKIELDKIKPETWKLNDGVISGFNRDTIDVVSIVLPKIKDQKKMAMLICFSVKKFEISGKITIKIFINDREIESVSYDYKDDKNRVESADDVLYSIGMMTEYGNIENIVKEIAKAKKSDKVIFKLFDEKGTVVKSFELGTDGMTQTMKVAGIK